MKLSPQGVARWSAKRRLTVIGIWVVLFLAGGLLTARYLGGALTTQAGFTNNPDSRQAQQLLEQRLSGPRRSNEVVIVRSDSQTVSDPQFKAYVQRLKADIDALGPGVVQATQDPYRAGGRFVSDDRHATLVPVTMAGSLDDANNNIDQVLDRTLHAQHPAGFKVWVAGEATTAKDSNTIAEQDLRKGETIGIIAALAILIVVFGTLAAAVVPIVLAIMAIVVALGLVSLLGLAFDLSFFITNMITMIGLAVGIDYSLFTVSRCREERARGRDKLAAIGAAGGTANRAVFFSGMTVVLALAAMLLNPTTIFRSIAAGAIVVVLVAVSASLTLLPALLAVMGDRVNALRVPVLFRRRQADVERTHGLWAGVARRVMARPVTSLVAAVGILALAAVPLFGIRTGFAGISTFPDDVQSKQAFAVLSWDFTAGGLTSPVQIVVDGKVRSPAVTAAISRLQADLKADRTFGPSTVQYNKQGDLALVVVPVNGDPSGQAATAAVRHLRTVTIPAAFEGVNANVKVGGQTAGGIDFFDLTHFYTPFAIAFVLALSFLLLVVVFRSVVLPALGVGAEPAVSGRRLRAAGVGVPAGPRRRAAGVPAGRDDRVVAAAVFVLGAVRAVHGLPGVPAQPHPGALRPHARQPRRGGVWPAHHRRDHHRRRGDHGGGVRRVRGRPAGRAAAGGLWPGGGGADRRHAGALGAGPRGDDPARQVELVPAAVARMAAAGPHRGWPPRPGPGAAPGAGRAGARAAAGPLAPAPIPRGCGGACSPATSPGGDDQPKWRRAARKPRAIRDRTYVPE
jgi:RND superfamily putative drug exporter